MRKIAIATKLADLNHRVSQLEAEIARCRQQATFLHDRGPPNGAVAVPAMQKRLSSLKRSFAILARHT